MSKDIIVIGAGGHSKVLIDALKLSEARILGVVDSNQELWGKEVLGVQILGGDEKLLEHDPSSVEIVNGIGTTRVDEKRAELYKRFKEKGYAFRTVVHPSAFVSTSAILEEGAQVFAGAVVQPGTKVFENAIVNTGASIDHDCSIGAHVHIAPGAVLSGGVQVSLGSHVGTGATLIQNIRISEGVTVGAGAVVVRDLTTPGVYVGNPAKRMEL